MTPQELKDYRIGRGISQQALADELEVSRLTVSNWEKGRFRIPADLMAKLATVGGSDKPKAAKILSTDQYWTKRPKPFGGFAPTLSHPFWYLSPNSPLVPILRARGTTWANRPATTADLDGYVAPLPEHAYNQLVRAGVDQASAYWFISDYMMTPLPFPKPLKPIEQRTRDENAWLVAHGTMAGFHDAHPQYPRNEPVQTPEQREQSAKMLQALGGIESMLKNL